jgi:RNA polymerase sigma-70 factor, ECF subfamily
MLSYRPLSPWDRRLNPNPFMEAPTTDPSTYSDSALVRLIADGGQIELAELWRRFAPTLLALGRRILGSLQDAEEVLQEVFVHVWNHADRYDAVSTWLVLIMRSRAIDRLRSRKVVERVHEASQAESIDLHTSPEGAENVLIQQRRERIRGELSKLPDEQREVLEMAFYEGLTQQEISTRSDTPLGTVKTRTLLAMKKLRKALRDDIRELL